MLHNNVTPGVFMPCERCEELELRYLERTEEYINLVERHDTFPDHSDAAGA